LNDFQMTRPSSSRLTDLGPLPEVRECNRETTWQLFLALQSGADSFPHTEPFTRTHAITRGPQPVQGELDVRAVLNEARRNNRASPTDQHWAKLRQLLWDATGYEPPPCAPTTETVTRLVKRMLLRDQIEWAADHGYLPLAMRFLNALPEENWVHMTR
jgi:hypothetical protein